MKCSVTLFVVLMLFTQCGCKSRATNDEPSVEYQYVTSDVVFDLMWKTYIDENDEAMHTLKKMANAGVRDAAYSLGFLYASGRAVPIDINAKQGHAITDLAAFKWYHLAAMQNHEVAQFEVGYMYRHGIGVEQSYRDAALWLRKAAVKDHAEAQYWLALMYQQGLNLPQDDRAAFKWFCRSARQGYAAAQYQIAYMYLNGRGVEKDKTKALLWLERAAELEHHYAERALQQIKDNL